MRGLNCSGRAGTTSRWPCSTIVGPACGPTVAASTGRPLCIVPVTSTSRASSQPLTKPAAACMPSSVEVS